MEQNKRIILGISRDTQFSPNHIGNDEAIFRLVCKHLQEAGYRVDVLRENDFASCDIDSMMAYKAVFGMVRSKGWLRLFKQAREKGQVLVNTAEGIENCIREAMTRRLLDAGVPHPRSLIVDVDAELDDSVLESYEPCWMKRADFHAIHKEDVSYVRTKEELREMMREFGLRGIRRVVINEHLKGDLVKFYGVAGTDFFHWFYPYQVGHSKFGLEAVNGDPTGIEFSVEKLQGICQQAAEALGVDVYGGDAIVDENGQARIIDFNDWPSFAPCREEAGKVIASLILKKIQDNEN